MNQQEARSIGIDVVGDVPWGTHFCQFYQTKQDMLDILVPYFAEGLRNNEACMWVTSEPLTQEAARDALRSKVPDLDLRLELGQMEVLPHSEWYLKGGAFDLERVLASWALRLERAIGNGFSGLRVTGNTAWLERAQWENFTDYEEQIDSAIARSRMLAVCTYSLDHCGANEVIDVVRNHQFALIKRGGKWEVIESAERKRTSALRQSEQLYRSLINTTGAWIVRLDREGQRTLVIGADSPTFKDVGNEILASKPGHIVIPEDKGKSEAALRDAFSTGRPTRGLVLRARLGGKLRYLVTHWEPITNARGETTEVQITSLDVTSQKVLEQQYYQAQKMESVGRLAGGVAHDFNNLLAVIDGYTAMALQQMPKDNPSRGNLEEVQAAVARAASLTRQLLTFSRSQPSESKVINPGELVTNLGKLLRRVIGEDMLLSITVAPGLPPIKADPGHLEQVLVNLAVNARDAMPKGGKLTIEVANVSLDDDYARLHSGTAMGEYVVIAVTDTGVGMTEEVKAHLFEPFYTTKPRGTGLGLATCYGIVKQADGHIGVYSELGRGTTVKVYLPLAAEGLDAEAAKPEVVIPRARAGETILMVEDEAGLRKLLAKMLEQLGYTVLPAASGQEAWHLARNGQHNVHLLLSDLVMPEMSGKQLAALIRADGPHIKVVYMSGYPDAAVAHSGALEAGAFFLQKPFSAASLAQKVREALDS